MILTIDGPAGSGKSTVARIVAGKLDLPCLNSGFIYRTVTLLVLEKGLPFEDHAQVGKLIQEMDLRLADDNEKTRVFVGEREVTSRLKDPDVTPQIHRVADDGFYRQLLVELQRKTAEPDGVVAEGRDMGTVIFPDAEHKFYLDAPARERARRQHEELEARGRASDYDTVLAEVKARDEHDLNRESAPLRIAEDAVVVETGGLSVEQVVSRVLSHTGSN